MNPFSSIQKFFAADTQLVRFLSKWFNAIIAGASIFCFSVFFYNAATYKGDSGFYSAIGKVASGNPEQKRHRSTSFSKAHTGDSVYFRDQIWVGPGQQVDLVFSDSTELRLFQNTMIVLIRHPGTDAAPSVKLIKGTLEITKVANSTFHVETADGTVENSENNKKKISTRKKPVPAGEKSPVPPAETGPPRVKGFYPVNGSLLYIVNAHEVNLTLAWPEPLSGTLIVAEQSGPEVFRKELEKALSQPVRLKVGKIYEWRIHPAVPSMSFEIKGYTAKALSEQLDPSSKRVIEIIGSE